MPENRSAFEVFRNYQGALKCGGFVELFSCAGGAQCKGSQSIGWCGGCSPHHLSAKLSRPEGDVYVSLHIAGARPLRRDNAAAWSAA